MAEGPPKGETQLDTQGEAELASDETVPHDSSDLSAHARTPRIRISPVEGPQKLGRYMIVKQLGRGGMGAVYEAEDPELGRRVAIKVLRDDRRDAQLTDALRREAQALAKLVHPNVISVYDVGVDDGRAFVVMQLVAGESIDRALRARKARPRQIVDAFIAAGRGLAAAHAAGLVHCDFKPGNVLVDGDGVVRVGDFGLARIGEIDGAVAGTPAYMAPEQFTGIATAATDQYAFCVALAEVLLGRHVFSESDIDQAIAARKRVPPEFPRSTGVPAYVARAIQRGLSRDVPDRFPSMDALLAALAPPAWRRWAIAGTGGALVVGGAVLATFAVTGRSGPPTAAEIRAGEPDITAARALTSYEGSACAYAPALDGDRVVFDRTEGDAVDLYMLPLAGGPARQLTSAPTMEWRANPGRHAGEVVHLVHDSHDTNASKIDFLDLATGRETVAAAIGATDAVSTPSGLVYIEYRGQKVRRISGERDSVLALAPEAHFFQELALSHRGDRIVAVAFAKRDPLLCVIDLTSGSVSCDASQAIISRPAFGADDRYIYYAAVDGIRRFEPATRADTVVLPDVHADGGLAIPPDGHAIIYSDCGARGKIVDWTAKPPTVLVDDSGATAPTGTSTKRVAWVRTQRGVPVLVARTEDGRELQLTDPSWGGIAAPAISPDGTRVLFRSGTPHPGLYVTDLNTRSTGNQRLSDGPLDAQPAWLGNDQIAFARFDGHGTSTAYTVRADGSMFHQLGSMTRFVAGGRKGQVLVASATGIYWVDVATGTDHPGPDLAARGIKQASLPTTSPDGRWLMFRQGSQGQVLARMSLDPPGPVEDLGAIPSGQTIDGASITNDGHVLIALQTWSGDLHVVPAQPDTRF